MVGISQWLGSLRKRVGTVVKAVGFSVTHRRDCFEDVED